MDILIVDQDWPFAIRLEKNLLNIGLQSDIFDCYERAGDSALHGDYRLLIVNIEKAGDKGSKFLEILSKARNTPVIVTSTNGEIETKVQHLRMGAVDYVVKPVDFEELMARVALQLRKRFAHSPVTSTLVFDDLKIHLSSGSVERGGRMISLTKQEFAILLHLARMQGKPVRRETLFENVWGADISYQENLINVAIGRLRRKLHHAAERKFLHTVHGIGYVAEYRD